MDIEILKKLIKLANHNPNENESNAAARKVCKMIEDEGFRALGAVSITPPNPRPQQRYTQNNIDELIRRAKEKEEQGRRAREERERKSKEDADRMSREAKPVFTASCTQCGNSIHSRFPITDRVCIKCKYYNLTGHRI